MKKILEIIEPADKMLQSRKSSLSNSNIVINAIMETIKRSRCEKDFNQT